MEQQIYKFPVGLGSLAEDLNQCGSEPALSTEAEIRILKVRVSTLEKHIISIVNQYNQQMKAIIDHINGED